MPMRQHESHTSKSGLVGIPHAPHVAHGILSIGQAQKANQLVQWYRLVSRQHANALNFGAVRPNLLSTVVQQPLDLDDTLKPCAKL